MTGVYLQPEGGDPVKRLLALFSLTIFLASTSALACDGAGKTSADGAKPASERPA
jgi:hypothetical protein